MTTFGKVPRVPLGLSFGIMQGRLSPQSNRGYQTFPEETWVNEFRLARDLGFDHIEWVLESFELENNPLLKFPHKIKAHIEASGVTVPSLCADFLMEFPLDPNNKESWAVFEQVMEYSSAVGIGVVVVPCVDNSSLLHPANRSNLENSLPRMAKIAERFSLSLALETDLPPKDFKNLLSLSDSPSISVNYDSGNSASLGYEFVEEMEVYGERISDFHLKDRVRGGTTVPLGTGSVNFGEVLDFLVESSFSGVVTMQAMRDAEGPPSAARQLNWLRNELSMRETEIN